MGGIIIDALDFTIPAEMIKVFRDRPRIIWRKVEWFGIHPIPIDALPSELKNVSKDFDILAVPKGMIGK